MTLKEYKTIQERLSNKDICGFAERMCEKGKIDPIADYPKKADSDVMPSTARRQMYLSKAIDLLRRMILLGATGLEVLRVSEYLVVILKSIDHSLDYRNCEKALKISELEQKYSKESFFALHIPFEDFLNVVSRDNDFYPVPIKEGTI